MFNVIRSLSVPIRPTCSLTFIASQNVTKKISPIIIESVRSVTSGSPTSMDKIQHTQEPTQKDRDVISHSLEDQYSTRSDEEGFGGSFTGNDSLSGREQEKLVHANAPEYDTKAQDEGSSKKE